MDVIVPRELEFYRAQTASDAAKLAEIMSDDLTHFVHATGRVDDKERYLEAVRSGRYAHGPIFRLSGRTKVDANSAVSTSVIDMVSRPAGTREFSMRLQQVLFWVKEGTAWRLLLRHAVREPL